MGTNKRYMFPRAKIGRPPKDNQLIFNAILWIAWSGSTWRNSPEQYGAYQTVYSRFCKWRDDGTLLKIFETLSVDSDFENVSIDSTSVKAHPQNTGAYFRFSYFTLSPTIDIEP